MTSSCETSDVDCFLSCENCKDSDINCPTTPNCNSCIVNCTGEESCSKSVLYGNDCNTVIVNGNSGNKNMKEMTIYAPSGDLYVNAISGDESFDSGEILTEQDNGKIVLSCYDDNKEECKESTINGSRASYVEYNCYGDAQCSKSTIYCPENAVGTSCVINCASVTGDGPASDAEACESLYIYARYGIPRTLELDCNTDVCTHIRIYLLHYMYIYI